MIIGASFPFIRDSGGKEKATSRMRGLLNLPFPSRHMHYTTHYQTPDRRTGSLMAPESAKGMEQYHAFPFCPEATAGKNALTHTKPAAFFGGCFMPSRGVQSGPSFLLLAFIFQRGALAEHAVDCSVLREQRREEEKPAMRESLVCPYVAVFSKRGANFPSRKKAVRTVCGQFCGQSRERGYHFFDVTP